MSKFSKFNNHNSYNGNHQNGAYQDAKQLKQRDSRFWNLSITRMPDGSPVSYSLLTNWASFFPKIEAIKYCYVAIDGKDQSRLVGILQFCTVLSLSRSYLNDSITPGYWPVAVLAAHDNDGPADESLFALSRQQVFNRFPDANNHATGGIPPGDDSDDAQRMRALASREVKTSVQCEGKVSSAIGSLAGAFSCSNASAVRVGAPRPNPKRTREEDEVDRSTDEIRFEDSPGDTPSGGTDDEEGAGDVNGAGVAILKQRGVEISRRLRGDRV